MPAKGVTNGVFGNWHLRFRSTPQLSGKPTYPANLCPLFVCAEFACYCEDLGETVGDAFKTAARSAVWQGAPKHLEQVLSGQQGVHYSFQAGARRGDLCFRLRG